MSVSLAFGLASPGIGEVRRGVAQAPSRGFLRLEKSRPSTHLPATIAVRSFGWQASNAPFYEADSSTFSTSIPGRGATRRMQLALHVGRGPMSGLPRGADVRRARRFHTALMPDRSRFGDAIVGLHDRGRLENWR